MPIRITDKLVKDLLSPPKGNTITYDTEVKGFGVRVTAAGARAFILNYRAGGVERRITIGSYPDWSVVAARDRARELKREVDRGNDPMGERHDDRAAPTVHDLWLRYEREHLPHKAPRAQADDRAMFRDYILPDFGRMKIKDVRPTDIDALHRAISMRRKIRANRVVEVLSKAFALATRWEWRSDNPCDGVRHNPEEPRSRYLRPDELARLAGALDQHPEQTSADAIRLMLLTGARRGEVLGATWSMFDLERGIWIKPSAHTKQRREHRVPISVAALDLLRRLKSTATSAYVFPGRNGAPLTDVKRTWQAVRSAAGLPDVRLHDLRHTYASLLASAGQSLPIIGALLGHTQPQTTARYAHLMDDPLRSAANQIGLLLAEIETAAAMREGADGT
jgi:integrase